MSALWLPIIGAIIVLLSLLFPSSRHHGEPSIPLYARGVGVLIGAVLVAASLVTTVPAQSVGVVTSFGKPTGKTFGAGLHLKAPWHKVSDMDGTVQQLNNLGASADKDHEKDPAHWRGRTTVRLNNNSLMFVENALRWKIRPAAAPGLYLDWRKGTGNIVENHVADGLVAQELASAINVSLSTYDPLTPGAPGQTTDQLAAKVTQRINDRIGDTAPGGPRIEVVSFTILRVDFDDDTQRRIINVQEEKARTAAALQRGQTAAAEATANDRLAASVAKNPNVLVSKCLDNQAKAIEKGMDMRGYPPCIPGVPGSQTVTPTS